MAAELLCIDDGGDELWLLDRTTPSNSTLIGEFPFELGNPTGLTSHNGELLCADNGGDELWLIDRDTPASSTLIGEFPFELGNPTLASPQGLTSHNGELLCIDNAGSELWLLDRTTPSNSTLIGTLPGTLTRPLGLTSHNGELLCIDNAGSELWLLDRTTPSNSTLIGTLPGTLTSPRGLTSHNGELLCIDNDGDELWLIDRDTPASSTLIGSLPSGLASPNGLTSHNADVAPSFADNTGDAQNWTQNQAITPITVPAAAGTPAPTYAAVGALPAGIQFNTSTRVLSGTPAAQGSGTITIRATNSEGMADWTVAYTTSAPAVTPAEVTDTQITSTPAALPDTYGLGEVIEFTVMWDGQVDVTGTPRFPMNLGVPAGGPEYADYAGGGGTAELTFEWVVAASDSDTNGIFFYGDTDTQDRGDIDLNGGTIRNLGTTVDADLTTLNRGTKSDHKVDGSLQPTDHAVDAGDASWAFAVPQAAVTHTPRVPDAHAVNAGDVAWAFDIPQAAVTYVPLPTDDHTVNAGDVSWAFVLPEPAVTHTSPLPQDFTRNAGDVSWAFTVPQAAVTHVPRPTDDHTVNAGDAAWNFAVPEPTVTYTPLPTNDHAVNAGDISWAFGLPQPTVTHLQLHGVTPGPANWVFAIPRARVTHIPLFTAAPDPGLPDFLPRETSLDLFISQWGNAVRLRTVAEIWLRALDVHLREPRQQLRLMQNLDSAEGVWLDRIGRRVGLDRLLIPTALFGTYFGFDDAGVSFDDQPFGPDTTLLNREPLGDGDYRNALRARIAMLTGDGGLADYQTAVEFLDPDATVSEGTLSITITTSLESLMRSYVTAGALLKIPGVEFMYASP